MKGTQAGPVPVREFVTRALYLLFAVACIGNGLWLLVDPVGWNGMLRMQAEDFGDGTLQAYLMRNMGAAYLCISLAFLWCLANAQIRRRVHPVLTLYFGLIAAIHVAGIASSQVPSHRWVTDAPLVLLPPLVLLAMMIPLPGRAGAAPAGARGAGRRPRGRATTGSGEETGTVKWFDTRKGFGFITRANGEELFVHYRAIREGSGQRMLRDGQPVRFRVGQGKKGPQAEDVVPLGKPG